MPITGYAVVVVLRYRQGTRETTWDGGERGGCPSCVCVVFLLVLPYVACACVCNVCERVYLCVSHRACSSRVEREHHCHNTAKRRYGDKTAKITGTKEATAMRNTPMDPLQERREWGGTKTQTKTDRSNEGGLFQESGGSTRTSIYA